MENTEFAPSLPTGIDFTHFDKSVRPQDDFFRYVNGAWLASAEIPADRSVWGSFHWLRVQSELRVKSIIDELAEGAHAPGTNAQKIGDLYRSFMNEVKIESDGAGPIAADLTAVAAIVDYTSFLDVMGNLETRGTSGIFGVGIMPDLMDSNTNVAYIGQSGLSLPDEAYYREEEFADIRSAFLEHLTAMFTLAGIDGGPGKAQTVLALETQIASHHWDNVRTRDMQAIYNRHTFAELLELSPAIDWKRWLAAARIPESALAIVIVAEPSFFTGVGKMLGQISKDPHDIELDRWKTWLQWQIITSASPYLSTPFSAENFNFYGRTLSGTPEQKVRWKRAVSVTEGALGEAIGEIFVAKFFPEESKAKMDALVDNLTEAYHQSISSLDWMSPETKAAALVKLSKFGRKIGYPDKWRDYSKLTIGTELIANLNAISSFEHDYEISKIGKPVDKTEWHMTPQTVNAYYTPLGNEIVFPAAILQAPFFNPAADEAVNYGGIGAVIGHEIGHGFDDQGSKFDGDGNMQNWWSEADLAAFGERTSQLIAQYDALHPTQAPEIHVNGALTIGENIGDLGGVMIGYKAYKLSLKGEAAPVIDGLTGEQRFFIGYAQVWCELIRTEELKRRVATDPHSPDEFRTNQIVKNFTEFYEAFDVKAGDALFMPEADRVRIW